MTADEALAFVAAHGVVLVSARGGLPTLTEAIAGEPIRGSWWGHPQGRRIFAILGRVTDSDDVLVCRLVDGKRTIVHRRLWPALVRMATTFAPERLARVRDVHTSSGRHVSEEIPFPEWVPAEVHASAASLSGHEARAVLQRAGLVT
jgi:hypothetical protein